MKKVLLAIVVMLALCGVVKADGFTVWGLTENKVGLEDNGITGRVGYQYDFIEAILGSTWRPDYDAEGDISPPQVFSLGVIAHMADVIDANNPIPWVPEFLLTFINDEMVAQPYFGFQGSFNIDSDAGFTGAIVGIQTKTKAENKSAMVFELAYNNNFLDLKAVPDNEIVFSFGFRFGF
uniref:Outer membrane protein beta-barrel domain-containing protein n=2 Tax=viral metagenome TaxID=1070528 RepID=A0A6M3JET2_9ZZZZ